MIKTKVIYFTVFFITLIYFLINTLLYLGRLGLNPDEACYGKFVFLYLTDFKKILPSFGTVRSFYSGAIKAYLSVPFFVIFGHTVFALRFTAVFFSLISLICIYYVCSRWFNRLVGLSAVLLLGTNSTFIRATRIGMDRSEIIQIFLVWLAIALIQLYIDGKKRIYLYFSAFVFGLALSSGIMFLAFFFGAVAAFAVLWDKSYGFLRNKIFKRNYDFVIFILMFIIGSSELLMFNIYNKAETIKVLWHSFWNIAASGWNNLDFFNNLNIRFNHLNALLMGKDIDSAIYIEINNYFNNIFFYLSLVSIIFYLLFWNKKIPFSKKKILFMLTTYFVIIILSCFTPTGNAAPYQLIFLFPAIQITCAIFLGLILPFSKRKILQYSLVLLFVIPNIYTEFNITKNYLVNVKNDMGRLSYSNLVYELTNYLEKNNINECLSVTFDISYNIEFITNQRVTIRYFTPGSYTEAFYESEIQSQENIYIISRKDNPASIEFFAYLRKWIYEHKDKTNIIFVQDFIDKRTNTHFELHRIEKKA